MVTHVVRDGTSSPCRDASLPLIPIARSITFAMETAQLSGIGVVAFSTATQTARRAMATVVVPS